MSTKIKNGRTELAQPTRLGNLVPAIKDDEAAILSQLNNAIPYRSYVALLNQTGINAPIPTVVFNNLGFTPIWSYAATGQYAFINTNNGFIVNKTIVFPGRPSDGGAFQMSVSSDSVTEIDLFTDVLDPGTGFVPTDGCLRNFPIEIRIYN